MSGLAGGGSVFSSGTHGLAWCGADGGNISGPGRKDRRISFFSSAGLKERVTEAGASTACCDGASRACRWRCHSGRHRDVKPVSSIRSTPCHAPSIGARHRWLLHLAVESDLTPAALRQQGFEDECHGVAGCPCRSWLSGIPSFNPVENHGFAQ